MQRIAALLETQGKVLEYLKSPLLLAIRLYWGWQFYLTGTGKLGRIEEVAAWFGDDLGIPFPLANAYLAALTEVVGGLALALGLGSRVVTLPLIVTMCVAYATADRQVLDEIWTNPDGFVTAAPFLYLLASVIVLVFGPGAFSVDRLVGLGSKKAAVGKPASKKGR